MTRGSVRKGERGTTIVFANPFTPEKERERAARDGDAPSAIPFLKRYAVFNTDQCDGLPADIASTVPPPDRSLVLPEADALMRATLADIRIGGDRAFYSPSHDVIQLPPPHAFFEPVEFATTALHELGHWSGHASRLARDMTGSFGSKSYAREGLVAEMAGAFVCAGLPRARCFPRVGAEPAFQLRIVAPCLRIVGPSHAGDLPLRPQSSTYQLT